MHMSDEVEVVVGVLRALEESLMWIVDRDCCEA